MSASRPLGVNDFATGQPLRSGGGWRTAPTKFLSALHGLVLAGQRLHDTRHRLLHVRIGQRAIRRPEREPQRQAVTALRNALALVPIELANLDERLRGDTPNGRAKALGTQPLSPHDRDVSPDGRKRGRVSALVSAVGAS